MAYTHTHTHNHTPCCFPPTPNPAPAISRNFLALLTTYLRRWHASNLHVSTTKQPLSTKIASNFSYQTKAIKFSTRASNSDVKLKTVSSPSEMKEVLPKTGPFFCGGVSVGCGRVVAGWVCWSYGRSFPSGFNAWLVVCLFGLVDASYFQPSFRVKNIDQEGARFAYQIEWVGDGYRYSTLQGLEIPLDSILSFFTDCIFAPSLSHEFVAKIQVGLLRVYTNVKIQFHRRVYRTFQSITGMGFLVIIP